jgi:hypothetical protein
MCLSGTQNALITGGLNKHEKGVQIKGEPCFAALGLALEQAALVELAQVKAEGGVLEAGAFEKRMEGEALGAGFLEDLENHLAAGMAESVKKMSHGLVLRCWFHCAISAIN